MTKYDRGKRIDNGEQNMKEKATIFDYARMCKFYDDCSICPLGMTTCHLLISGNPDKANEIILNWCKEHPVETRQDRLLKMFPNAPKLNTGILSICTKTVDVTFDINCSGRPCSRCYKDYWLAEVDDGK